MILHLLMLLPMMALPAAAQDAERLIAAARAQVGVTPIYDPAYVGTTA